jgi:hypothetical protein
LRQGDIALIHSAAHRRKMFAKKSRSRAESNVACRSDARKLCARDQCPLEAFFIAASCSALAEP